MKRIVICICLLAVVGLLGGCFLEPAEGLYAVPKQPEEYYNLQSAIEAAMPAGASYSPPTAGENQQAVQLTDLDGDGEDEAIVYLKTTGDLPLAVYVFDKQGECFSFVSKVEGSGSAFDHVLYVPFDDRPGYEIVLGRQISGQVLQLLNVYALRDGTLTELMNAVYSEFITIDLNGSGMQDIFVIRSDDDMQKEIVELYSWEDGQLFKEREVSSSANVTTVKRIITGNVTQDVPAVFVSSELDEEHIITDIYAYNYGIFENLTRSEQTNTSVQTLRNYNVYSCDIDGDGLIELPRIVPLREIEGDDGTKDQSLIEWYNLDVDGQETDKLLTYHNYAGGWHLEIPSDWKSSLIVWRGPVLLGNTGYVFSLGEASLFSVVPVSGEDAAGTVQEAGWSLLMQKGDVFYACRVDAGGRSLGLTVDTIRNMFRFIHVDWKTGET